MPLTSNAPSVAGLVTLRTSDKMSAKSAVESTKSGDIIRSKKGMTLHIEQMVMYCCNECGELLEGARYACSECCHYDSCFPCARKNLHQHLLYREDRSASSYAEELRQLPSMGEVIRRAFKIYGHRQLFGYRDASQITTPSPSPPAAPSDSSLPPLPPYRWITYEEAGTRVDHIGRGLRQLVEPRTFVGICSRVQLGWYLADYTCQINSIIGPVFSQNCSVEDITHIITKTGMKLVFVAAETLPRFLAASAACPTLEFIVQLEDLDDNAIHSSILESRLYTRQFKGLEETCQPSSLLDIPFAVPFWSESIVSEMDKKRKYKRPLQLTPDQAQIWRSKILSAPKPAVFCLSDLERIGVHLPEPAVRITKSDELETLIFTSGSTGLPKGAMFSGVGWRGQAVLPTCSPRIERTLTWTISDRTNDLRQVFLGSAIAIYNGDASRLFEDLAEVRPHQLNATPTFWNKIYTEFEAELKERTRHLSNKVAPSSPAPSSSEPSSSESASTSEAQAPIKRLTKREKARAKHEIREGLMKEYRELIGGRVERIVTGGAPTSKEVLDFMWDCFSGRIAESYGTTEAGGITVRGEFVSGLDWKLVAWEEYTPHDTPFPRGELCVKGREMMEGYYGDPETTKAALDDEGYYRTGDIVQLNAAHSGATIVDRKKNIFKLSQGEYVAPAKMERLIQTVPYVQQVFVYGNSHRDSLVAVIVPHIESVRQHYNSHKESLNLPEIPLDDASLCVSPFVVSFFLSEIALVGLHNKLRTFEIPAAVHLTTIPFTTDNGLQTASEKNSRHAIHKIFKDEIEALYASLETTRSGAKLAVEELIRSQLSLPSVYTPSTANGDSASSSSGANGFNGKDITFAQVGGDSLSAVKLRRAIKQQFDVNVPLDVLLDPNMSVEGLANLVADPARHALAESSQPQIDLQQVASLDPTWKPVQVTSESTVETGVFLTGATGFLGTAILCELLSTTSLLVYCLVRPQKAFTERSMAKRLVSTGLIPGLTNEAAESLVQHRIKLVYGTLEEPHFGLGNAWEGLQQAVSLLIHCGAHVNHVMPYQALAPANVEGTRTCIEMCTQGRHKKLVYISTVSVVANGFALDRPLSKATIPPSLLTATPGYTSSKYIGEVLVWGAIERGFEAVVIRPGFLGSAASSGFANATDVDNRLLRGLALLNASPIFAYGFNLATMPVDYMAKSVLRICDLEGRGDIPKELRCFHLESGESELSVDFIVDELERRGYINRRLDYEDWKTLVSKMDETNPLFTLSETLTSRISFPNRMTRNPAQATYEHVLSKMEAKHPKTETDFVKRWIDWLEENGYLTRPK